MGRSPCCAKEGLNRGAWTAMEDKILTEYIKVHGEGKWRNLPKRAGLKRCGKSCRLRWLNYLRPDIKRGNITHDEEELIIRLHNLLGNRWSLIAGRLPGRTDNEIKNYWNTTIGKKIQDHVPSSFSHYSLTNSHKKPPNQTHLEKKPKPSNTNTNTNTNSCTKVVRTKASRCTKVVIPQQHKLLHDDDIGDQDQIGETEQVFAPFVTHHIDQTAGIDTDQALMSPFVLSDDQNGTNSCEFMVDFKMDENFLSDFLNVDVTQLYNNINVGSGEAGKAAAATSDKSQPYDSTDQTILFSEDRDEKLHGPDFQSSMAPITDSELDWLIDISSAN